MRIAWIGPMPNNSGGASGVGRQLLVELSRQGVEVDCYFPGKADALPQSLVTQQNLRFFCQPSAWEWDRWYSKNNYMAFVTGQYANLRSEMKLAEALFREHKAKPYDLIYQFSHIEMHALKRFKRYLPPIILHPSVHAAGELKWHRKETHLSKVSESPITRFGVRLMLMARSHVQKRHIRDADYIFSISKNFEADLRNDYKVDPKKASFIVPNPIDVDKFTPGPGVDKFKSDNRITILFVSRISVRKGTEMIVELSHRLQDLSDQVSILVAGNHTLWSNYRGLLKRLNPKVATYIGQVSGNEMHNLYNSVDALIQPSHYEPFGLTVGEALACGVPVIASDKIGAAEEVEASCCRIFPAGDMQELERQVRGLIHDLQSGKRQEIAQVARSEAVRLFSDSTIVANLVKILHDITGVKQTTEPRGARLKDANIAANV